MISRTVETNISCLKLSSVFGNFLWIFRMGTSANTTVTFSAVETSSRSKENCLKLSSV